jgi:membrane protein
MSHERSNQENLLEPRPRTKGGSGRTGSSGESRSSAGGGRTQPEKSGKDEHPFGAPRSSDEPREVQQRRAKEAGRGRDAVSPLRIPWTGWKDILWRAYNEMQNDRLFSVAGGVAFFALLAIFPAIAALISAYGIFFDPRSIAQNLPLLSGAVPDQLLELVQKQAEQIASTGNGTLSIGLVVGIVLSLWSAMSGVKAVIDALNVIYEQRETRSFLKLNLIALLFTIGGYIAFLVATAAVVAVPIVLSFIGFGSMAGTVMAIGRWPALFIGLLIGLGILYRYGPNRRLAQWSWVSVGSLFAAPVWLPTSFLFSYFLSHFANYNATYGSLGAAAGLMMWLWISATVVLLGAELNAEIEHQTARDSTIGEEKPLGRRGAVMADTVGKAQVP